MLNDTFGCAAIVVATASILDLILSARSFLLRTKKASGSVAVKPSPDTFTGKRAESADCSVAKSRRRASSSRRSLSFRSISSAFEDASLSLELVAFNCDDVEDNCDWSDVTWALASESDFDIRSLSS